jgi:hypothetical protein
MKFLYYKQAAALFTVVSLTGVACGQNSKVKTITIINGDTTVSEKEIGDKDIADIEKQITMVINEDGDSAGKKKVIKKIIINGDDKDKGDAMAYAYSIGEGDGEDVEVTTDDNSKETKIIIKKGDKEDDKKEGRENKTVINRSTNSTSGTEKESMSLNISVNKNTAKIDVETAGKEALNISILDENGKQVFYDTQKGGGKYSKEVKLEKGTYFLNIIRNKKSTTDKIVIQ